VFEWNPRELIQAHRCRQLDAALVKDRNRRISPVGAVPVKVSSPNRQRSIGPERASRAISRQRAAQSGLSDAR